ncbi:MAG: hypothetical protein JETT_0797 [Candidatus Jettenia ecosi]|uniref:Uncharacterized protein n=1 Tax=Candidatus Jettenia ecosi TaxID=2494326 RepID=A0A533QDS4_9BACT|nr:MAG: hypothetical protein JETT_0797 [Candidatus Jettenia ecosi]
MKDYTKGRSPEMLEPFFPNEMFRHIIVSCFLVILEFVAVIFFPLPFQFVDKPAHIPWFFLPLYNLKKLIHNEVLFISVLALCALFLVSWPFLVRVRSYCLLFLNKIKITNSCTDCYSKVNYPLWQKPVPFAVVIIAIFLVINLCLINV